MPYRLDLANEEVGVVVEALQIQLERWRDALAKLLADPGASPVSLDQAQTEIQRHEDILKRLPETWA